MFTLTLLVEELGPLLSQIMTGVALTKDTEQELWGDTLTTLQTMLGDLYLHVRESACALAQVQSKAWQGCNVPV